MRSTNTAHNHRAILREEFPEVSRQTIYTALKYFNDSPTAKAIRRRAKELLENEAKEVIV